MFLILLIVVQCLSVDILCIEEEAEVHRVAGIFIQLLGACLWCIEVQIIGVGKRTAVF